ncbi:folate-binding protein YgfZ [Limnohabitans sp. 2KL-17]|uniref:CAF17-like 4Fe-4S cluster assembly/insertion protein YgfZ n=1 Tax=Limnohabitans sp. 2KL-17 TaxID=1100704 RepID=UPI000D3462C2|nr:folate-binding protein YgfZ [Limnohabitans sp. 2KL-17]PUE63261.1 folate-binding protein YgfZ [Limnohabitans sp. 2KL-17]
MNTPAELSPQTQALLNGVSALPQWGVIQAQGEDAANFLHNQLSNDVLLLPVGQSRLAAFCSSKGRMQASFVVIKTSPDTVLLVLSLDLLAQTLKRLSMFVLRAKVKLSDVTAQWQLFGLLGEPAQTLLADAEPWQTVPVDAAGHAVALYPMVFGDLRLARALWLAPNDQAAPAGEALATELWQWAEVLSAVPLINLALFEAFIPQMLNYESVGGVNFKKGCYPGQEVVARSQYRGTLKRRMLRAFSPQQLIAGQELYAIDEPDQPCATVVMASPRPDGSGWDSLVCGTQDLRKVANLQAIDVPYAILNDTL